MEISTEDSNKIADFITIFYPIYKTVIEMLNIRGYKNLYILDIIELLEIEATYFKDNKELKRSIFSLDIEQYKHLPHIKIYFLDYAENSIGVSDLAEPFNSIKNDNINDMILITPQDLTSQALNGINELKTKNITLFYDKELTFNVLNHRLSPKYELLTLEQTKLFFQENKVNVQPKQMPKIYEKDPAIKFLGGRAGQVVRIIRNNYSKNLLVNSTISYRLIIEGSFVINTKK